MLKVKVIYQFLNRKGKLDVAEIIYAPDYYWTSQESWAYDVMGRTKQKQVYVLEVKDVTEVPLLSHL